MPNHLIIARWTILFRWCHAEKNGFSDLSPIIDWCHLLFGPGCWSNAARNQTVSLWKKNATLSCSNCRACEGLRGHTGKQLLWQSGSWHSWSTSLASSAAVFRYGMLCQAYFMYYIVYVYSSTIFLFICIYIYTYLPYIYIYIWHKWWLPDPMALSPRLKKHGNTNNKKDQKGYIKLPKHSRHSCQHIMTIMQIKRGSVNRYEMRWKMIGSILPLKNPNSIRIKPVKETNHTSSSFMGFIWLYGDDAMCSLASPGNKYIRNMQIIDRIDSDRLYPGMIWHVYFFIFTISSVSTLILLASHQPNITPRPVPRCPVPSSRLDEFWLERTPDAKNQPIRVENCIEFLVEK